MARSDLLLSLVRAGSRGDHASFRRALEALVAEERVKQHHVLADQLAQYLKGSNGELRSPVAPVASDERVQSMVLEIMPRKKLDGLILPDAVVRACNELIEEHYRRDLLRSYGLEPRHRVLLVGPPGNGKTSVAEGLAEALALPLYVVRYDGIVGSYLGETAIRLRRLFEFVKSRPCVLFFDEFDTLGKERGDVHDTGEIKRVVSSLLLQLDDMPSHVVLVTATNHPELLDRAVWRRFQLRLTLPRPTRAQLERWFVRFQERTGQNLGLAPRTLADKLHGLNFAEVEEFGLDVLRRWVCELPGGQMQRIVGDRLKQWQTRANPAPTSEEE